MTLGYINTDFELLSEHDLSPLIKAFGEGIIVLNYDREKNLNCLCLEMNDIDEECFSSAEETISRFCDLVESFPQKAKQIWESCTSRIADIGYQSGQQHPRGFYSSPLNAKTIQRLATLHMGVTITIYPTGGYGDEE